MNNITWSLLHQFYQTPINSVGNWLSIFIFIFYLFRTLCWLSLSVTRSLEIGWTCTHSHKNGYFESTCTTFIPISFCCSVTREVKWLWKDVYNLLADYPKFVSSEDTAKNGNWQGQLAKCPLGLNTAEEVFLEFIACSSFWWLRCVGAHYFQQ